jgi:hypothetical protein
LARYIRGNSGFSGGTTEEMGKTEIGKTELDEILDPTEAWFPTISHGATSRITSGHFFYFDMFKTLLLDTRPRFPRVHMLLRMH